MEERPGSLCQGRRIRRRTSEEGARVTNPAEPSAERRSGSSDPSIAASFAGSWGVLAGAARAALSMIPTSEEGRTRQELLVRELELAADGAPGEPHAAVPAGGRHLVESTLMGLREPASTRPYDAERAQALRRQVLAFVVEAADEAAAVHPRPGSEDVVAVTRALRAGRLAKAVLADDPPVTTARSCDGVV